MKKDQPTKPTSHNSASFNFLVEAAKAEAKQQSITNLLAKNGHHLNGHRKICCPFHQEKTPSFSVTSSDDYFTCFGSSCEAQGDIIDLVRRFNPNLSFHEALNEILGREAIPIRSFERNFHSSRKNPTNTADNYVEFRGFPRGKYPYKQGEVSIKMDRAWIKKASVFVEAKALNGDVLQNHRIIDFNPSTDGSKTRFNKGNQYQGEGVVYQKSPLDWTRPIMVTEGFFEDWSLTESLGFQGIATLTTSNDAREWFERVAKEHPEAQFILAFNNDQAGRSFTKKMIGILKELKGPTPKVALPPPGMDWNDLHRAKKLTEDEWKISLWCGELFTAESALEYYRVYCKVCGNSTMVFEYHHQMYKGYWKKEGKGDKAIDVPSVLRLTDCSMRILYSIEDDSIPYQSKTKHRIQLFSQREKSNIVQFSSDDLANTSYFKSQLMHYRQLYYGGGQDLNYLVECLFKQNPAKIRQCQALGYDEKSNCYVFPTFLYDSAGNRHQVNKEGYFDKQKLASFQEKDSKVIENIKETEIKVFLQTLFDAYSYRGFTALGFWIASLFSYHVFNEFGFFPYMVIHVAENPT